MFKSNYARFLEQFVREQKEVYETRIKELEQRIESLRKDAEERDDILRGECDERVERERQRADRLESQAKIQERMLLDRLLAQSGVPQMYGTVEYREPESRELNAEAGLPPGVASVLEMQKYEDELWRKRHEEMVEQARQLALLQQSAVNSQESE